LGRVSFLDDDLGDFDLEQKTLQPVRPEGFIPLGYDPLPMSPDFGAGEGIRTLDPNLGKVVLYP
jgi:hypothetical protein